MLAILGIDTSTQWGSVIVRSPSGDVAEHVWLTSGKHTSEVMPAIVSILKKAKVTLDKIAGIAVAVGPGGFTSIRVGISTAIGLAMPYNLPIACVPTHAIEATPYIKYASEKEPLYSVIPLGREGVSWVRHSSNDFTDSALNGQFSTYSDLSKQIEPTANICGEGVGVLCNLIDAKCLATTVPTRLPTTLLSIATNMFYNNKVFSVPPIPIYH